MQKTWVLKCRLNRSGEWLNLESRALVPWDLVKLDFGGVVLADGAVLDGKLIQADTSQVNEEARNVLPRWRRDESFESAPPSSLAAKPARFEGRGLHRLLSQSSILCAVGHGLVDPEAGALRVLKTEVEKSFM